MKPYENINRDALAALSNMHDRVIDLEPGIDYEISSPANPAWENPDGSVNHDAIAAEWDGWCRECGVWDCGVDGHLDYPYYDDDFHGVDWPAAFGLAAAGWGILYVAWHLIRWVL